MRAGGRCDATKKLGSPPARYHAEILAENKSAPRCTAYTIHKKQQLHAKCLTLKWTAVSR
jgi:hypothetical protein